MTDNNESTKTEVTSHQPESQTATNESRITVHRIYIKGQQFIVNGLPDELSKNWSPQLSMQANPRVISLGPERGEVVLTLQLSAQQSGKVIFQIQIDQAGLFTLQNVSSNQQETAWYGACPNILFPYAAVMVNQVLSTAGLPHIYLNPMDFITLYYEHKKQEQERKEHQERQQKQDEGLVEEIAQQVEVVH